MTQEQDADPVFPSLDAFVENYVVHLYRRQVGEMARNRWDARWWSVPEAVIRLEAMWRSWEQLRGDGALGMSTWLLSHGDPHMRVLMDPEGPFRDSTAQARSTDPLPVEPAPEGMFPVYPAQPVV